MSDTTQKVYVRYVHGGRNHLPIQCNKDDTIYELAENVKANAQRFKLRSEDIDVGDVDIFLVNGDTRRLLDFSDVISEQMPCNKFEFDNHPSITLYVKYVSSRNPERMTCKRSDTVSDLVKHIIEKIDEFSLGEDDKIEVTGTNHDVILTQQVNDSDHVDMRRSLDPMLKLGDIDDNYPVVFETVRKWKRLAQSDVDLEDIMARCSNQKIGFFGPKDMGNHLSLSEVYAPLATTWSTSAGTMVTSDYRIDMDGKVFHLVDVPGRGLLTSAKDTKGEIIGRILDGKHPKDKGLDYFTFSSDAIKAYLMDERIGQLHAAVFVHNGLATPDKIGSLLVRAATDPKKGRSIPVFAMISHIDKLTKDQLEESIKHVSAATGIDRASILTIQNYDFQAREVSDPIRDKRVLRLLHRILSAAKIYKEKGRVAVK